MIEACVFFIIKCRPIWIQKGNKFIEVKMENKNPKTYNKLKFAKYPIRQLQHVAEDFLISIAYLFLFKCEAGWENPYQGKKIKFDITFYYMLFISECASLYRIQISAYVFLDFVK